MQTPVPVAAIRPDVPEKLSVAIATCLVRDPAMRFANVAELARAIAPFGTLRARRALERVESFAHALPRAMPSVYVDTTPPGTRTIASGPPPDMPRPRRLAAFVVLAAVAGAIAGAAALVALGVRTPAAPPSSAVAIVASAPAEPTSSEPPVASVTPTTPADFPPPSAILPGLTHRAHHGGPHAPASGAPSSDRFR
jgi:serine/threonine-protein kinase